MFTASVNFVLSWEGGYVKHPQDPGGATNWGISQRSFPDLDIVGLTLGAAMGVYRRRYWQPILGDSLPPLMALVTFDYAVNSGVPRASRALQRSLGSIVIDGQIGPKTIRRSRVLDDYTIAMKVIDQRLRFLTAHVKRVPEKSVFLFGWMRRVTHLAALVGTLK